MTLRPATEADLETLYALWDEWVEQEVGVPAWVENAQEGTRAGIDEAVRSGAAVIAEDGGEALGFACGVMTGSRMGDLVELYVRPPARRRGLARELVAAVVAALRERGAQFVTGGVAPDNPAARAFYERAGFRPSEIRLVADVETLERELVARQPGRSFGSIHVQSDDLPAVERAVRQFVPRLPGRSRGSVVAPPRHRWVGVYDELCDRDPEQLRRLGRELSDRLGAVVLVLGVEDGAVVRFVLYERGRVMDEYVSVPEHRGPLPPGIVVSLAANPTVVARLTGADPAAVRAAAPQAASAGELPPAEELLASLADVLGVEGGEHGYAEARGLTGAIAIERE
ncbi:MAG: GNAT family N-acetyltransferase [Thermoleophilia bacterium]|nr:GNAT family N-acetyltransferase [Thermoleophilia bacterium]